MVATFYKEETSCCQEGSNILMCTHTYCTLLSGFCCGHYPVSFSEGGKDAAFGVTTHIWRVNGPPFASRAPWIQGNTGHPREAFSSSGCRNSPNYITGSFHSHADDITIAHHWTFFPFLGLFLYVLMIFDVVFLADLPSLLFCQLLNGEPEPTFPPFLCISVCLFSFQIRWPPCLLVK